MARAPTFRPAWWIPGAHGQTLWGKFFRRRPTPLPRRERIDTPDGDFLDLYQVDAPAGRPHLFFLHGLEGTVRSHYVSGFLGEAARRGWGATLLIFRGCGDEPNRQPRFYHSGETGDFAFALDRMMTARPDSPFVLAGVSLGANVLLKWLGERGADVPERIRAAAAISSPFDLERAARHLQHGFARVYDRHFVQTLREKASRKLGRYPGLFDPDALAGARTVYDFDDAVTAPVHGFENAHDYYTKSSSLGWLNKIRLPTLLLSAMDDPFLPRGVLDDAREVAGANPMLSVEFTERGGHVGFVSGAIPTWAGYYGEWRACEFLSAKLSEGAAR